MVTVAVVVRGVFWVIVTVVMLHGIWYIALDTVVMLHGIVLLYGS